MSCLLIEELLGLRHLDWPWVHDVGHMKSHILVLLHVLGRLLESHLLVLFHVLSLGRLLHCQQKLLDEEARAKTPLRSLGT